MLTTQQVLALLRSANPTVALTEDRVRHAVRRQIIEPPDTLDGRWAWRSPDVRAVARVLGLTAPVPADIKAPCHSTVARAGARR